MRNGVRIIYSDPDFLIVDKPAGLLVHPISGKEEETLAAWLAAHYPQVKKVGDKPQIRPGIVHRLDRDVSGLLLIALSQRTFDYFKKLFQKREIKKTYQAVVWGIPKKKSGVIDKPLGLKPNTLKRTVHTVRAKMVKKAITCYRLIKVIGNKALLEVRPLTGRTHQIRAHLASIGHPIVGDRLYAPQKPSARRLFLRAVALEFTDLHGRRLKIEGEPLF